MKGSPSDTVEKINNYTFQFSWPTVVKGLWIKYPNKHLSFVKFNHVIDMEIVDSNTIKIKKLMYSKVGFFFMYSIEDIIIDFKGKSFDMTTSMLKKSKAFPFGKENCKYMGIDIDGVEKTLYTKRMLTSDTILKWMNYFQNSFVKGCKIIDENCKNF